MKAISIENLNYAYKNGFEALSEINLEIGSGEFVAIVGEKWFWKNYPCETFQWITSSFKWEGINIWEGYKKINKNISNFQCWPYFPES